MAPNVPHSNWLCRNCDWDRLISILASATSVEWHMREAWRAMLFADEDQAAKSQRDPVAPAQRSAKAEHKARTHTLSDGTPAHSFRTLLEELSTIVRNTCRTAKASASAPTFTILTQPNPIQQRALQLLDTISM
jgi:hypothetical protein